MRIKCDEVILQYSLEALLRHSRFPKHREGTCSDERSHRIEQEIMDVPDARGYEGLMPLVARTV